MRMPRFCLTWHEDAKASGRIGFVLVSGLFYDLLSTTRLGNSALEERKKGTKEGPAWSGRAHSGFCSVRGDAVITLEVKEPEGGGRDPPSRPPGPPGAPRAARRGQHPHSRAAAAHCQTAPSLTWLWLLA